MDYIIGKQVSLYARFVGLGDALVELRDKSRTWDLACAFSAKVPRQNADRSPEFRVSVDLNQITILGARNLHKPVTTLRLATRFTKHLMACSSSTRNLARPA